MHCGNISVKLGLIKVSFDIISNFDKTNINKNTGKNFSSYAKSEFWVLYWNKSSVNICMYSRLTRRHLFWIKFQLASGDDDLSF